MTEPRSKRFNMVRSMSRPNGRSSIDIECPYCDVIVEAYCWSLAGCGKRCDCGAIHSKWGMTYAPPAGAKR